jgi:type IV pilus assembly protein PilC
MFDLPNQFVESNLPETVGLLLLSAALYFIFVLVPFCAALYAVCFLVTLPMRRNERARLFLDLLELGLKDGHSPEAAIMRASSSRDWALGARFHLLAAYLEQGIRFTQALDEVPRLLPPRITAMLKVGDRIGDIAKVLPACRQALQDGISHVRGAHNYLVLLAFVITPLSAAIPVFLRIKVMPSFKALFADMLEGRSLPAITRFVFEQGHVFFFLQTGLVLLIWILMISYLGGPRFEGWLRRVFPLPIFLWPWTRKRLYRDFSAMLAALLDGGVPEKEAVKLAGEATANRIMIERASKVQSLLEQGISLPEAIQSIGDTHELRWRLSNALRRSGGFLRALGGWHEALDAKAYQQEQAAAQVTTTALVLINGATVGLIVIAIFLALIQLINTAILW